MNTISSNFNLANSSATKTNDTKKMTDFWEKAEYNRFGIIPMVLLIISCLGGIAAAFGAGSNSFQIALIIFPTILSLAFMLAVAPMRIIFWTSACALFFDVLVFFI